MGAKEQGADATKGRWLTMPRTLLFVTNGNDVLLMRRAAHKRVFPNQYNGLGGHVERDEDPYSSALREIEEESGLKVHTLQLCSIHNVDAGADTGILLFVFTAESTSREITISTPEGILEWIPQDKVLDRDLVEDLPMLLPRILKRSHTEPPLYAHVSYSTEDVIHLRFRQRD